MANDVLGLQKYETDASLLGEESLQVCLLEELLVRCLVHQEIPHLD